VNVDSLDADRMAIGPLAGSPSRSLSFTVNTAAHKHRLPGWLAQPEGKFLTDANLHVVLVALLARPAGAEVLQLTPRFQTLPPWLACPTGRKAQCSENLNNRRRLRVAKTLTLSWPPPRLVPHNIGQGLFALPTE